MLWRVVRSTVLKSSHPSTVSSSCVMLGTIRGTDRHLAHCCPLNFPGCLYLLTSLHQSYDRRHNQLAFLDKVLAHPEWPTNNGIFNHPSEHLMSWSPFRLTWYRWPVMRFGVILGSWLQYVTCDWPNNPATWFWPSSPHVVCTESFSHQPGSLCCKSILHKWVLASSDKCRCRCGMVQAVWHTVNKFPLTVLFGGGLRKLHLADDNSVTGWTKQHWEHAWNKIAFDETGREDRCSEHC